MSYGSRFGPVDASNLSRLECMVGRGQLEETTMARKASHSGLAFILIVCLASAVHAETVVLTDGRTLQGEVRVLAEEVRIDTRYGSLTLPRCRVLRVGAGPADLAQADAHDAVPAQAAMPEEVHSGPAVPQMDDPLARPVNVEVRGTPMHEAVPYVADMTGMNLAIQSPVRTDIRTVDMRVREMPAREVLKLMLEPNGYGYCVMPGRILRIGPAASLRDPETAVYDVTDLLVSRADAVDADGSAGPQRRTVGPSVGLNLQVAAPAGNVWMQMGRGEAAVTAAPQMIGGAWGSPMVARSTGMVSLIQGCCGIGTWSVDAAGVGAMGAVGGSDLAQPEDAYDIRL
jgi:hypothetical protein